MIKFTRYIMILLVLQLYISSSTLFAEVVDESVSVILGLNQYEIVYAYDSPIFIQDNRTMIPVELIEDMIGGEVNETDDTISILFLDQEIKLNKKLNVANVDGVNIKLDTRIITNEKNGLTYIPIRILIDTYNLDTSWNHEFKQVSIQDSNIMKTSKVEWIEELDWDGNPENIEEPYAFQIQSFDVSKGTSSDESQNYKVTLNVENITGNDILEGKADIAYWIYTNKSLITLSGGARTMYESRPMVLEDEVIYKNIDFDVTKYEAEADIQYIIFWPRTSKEQKTQTKY